MVAPGRTMVAFFKACANDWVGKEKTGRPRRGSSRKRWLSKDSITGTRVSLAGCSPAEPASVSPSFCRAGGVRGGVRGKSERLRWNQSRSMGWSVGRWRCFPPAFFIGWRKERMRRRAGSGDIAEAPGLPIQVAIHFEAAEVLACST